jgi:hypothetical protein
VRVERPDQLFGNSCQSGLQSRREWVVPTGGTVPSAPRQSALEGMSSLVNWWILLRKPRLVGGYSTEEAHTSSGRAIGCW